MPLSSEEVQKILDHAWKYGHFSNPKYPDAMMVGDHDIPKLGLDDKEAKQAIASVQASDIQLERMCESHHLRGLNIDGDPGPATLELTNLRRCSVPDFASEEYGEANVGWQKCDPDSDAEHSVRIKFDDRRAPAKWDSYLDDVLENAVKISADIGLDVRYVDHNASEWESSVIFKVISGGVIGFYYFPQGGCRRIPEGALDSSYQPNLELASLLWIHEGLGHGIGLAHTRGGIMNPSIIRSEMSWRNDPSWRAVKSMYGGVPLDPGPDPDPDPTPGGSIEILDGKVKFRAKRPGDYAFMLIEDSEV